MKKQPKKIVTPTDGVLVFANRKRLWRKGITPIHKLSEDTVSFLLFLENHNALFDFIETFKTNNRDGYLTISEYFTSVPKSHYLRGAFNWQFTGHYTVWNGLNELWIKKNK